MGILGGLIWLIVVVVRVMVVAVFVGVLVGGVLRIGGC